MAIAGNLCERCVVLPGGGPPAYFTSAELEVESTTFDISSLLAISDQQVISWSAWQEMSRSFSTRRLNQIRRDIPFTEDMGVGLWYFGRIPFLQRLVRSATTVETDHQFAEASVKGSLLGGRFRADPTLPGYLAALATQLSAREPAFSSRQWRTWLDMSLSFSFPQTAPTERLWEELSQYSIPIPGSPELKDIRLIELIREVPNATVLPLAAAGMGSGLSLLQADYVTAWIIGGSGAGIALLLAGTQSLISTLSARAAPIPPPAPAPQRRRRRQPRADS